MNSKPLAFWPGFVRGLAFRSKYAFFGLFSPKPRYARFEGLPLDQKLKDADSEPWCGLRVIDLDQRRLRGVGSGLTGRSAKSMM